jgi:hypothetical protein
MSLECGVCEMDLRSDPGKDCTEPDCPRKVRRAPMTDPSSPDAATGCPDALPADVREDARKIAQHLSALGCSTKMGTRAAEDMMADVIADALSRLAAERDCYDTLPCERAVRLAAALTAAHARADGLAAELEAERDAYEAAQERADAAELERDEALDDNLRNHHGKMDHLEHALKLERELAAAQARIGELEKGRICAFDLDECTATLAFDDEATVRQFMAPLKQGKRSSLLPNASGGENAG